MSLEIFYRNRYVQNKLRIRVPIVFWDRALKIKANRQSTPIHELTMMKPSTMLIKTHQQPHFSKSVVEATEDNNLVLV